MNPPEIKVANFNHACFFFFPYLKSVDSSRKNILQFNYTAKRASSGAKQIKLICVALSFRFSLSEIPFKRQKKVSNVLFRFLDISLAPYIYCSYLLVSCAA